MKKQDLLNYFDDELLDKLFSFCYARTHDSYEAEELCSDILYELVKAANGGGELESAYSFIWRVARNVYADFSKARRKRGDAAYGGDPEELLLAVADEDISDDTAELLSAVYRRIAFLTRAYREVMIMFYIDGLTTAQIAEKQGTSEGAVRQRLFSARQKIKSEVEEMKENSNKPVALDKMEYVLWGNGSPAWCDPRNVCTRTFSEHIVWLCHKKPMSASEIAAELNVPTVYVEEELEILRRGDTGKYGMLRKLDNGKYALNFILLDNETFEAATALYREQVPQICEIISSYIEAHKDEYLAFPYLNKRVDMGLILWQQIKDMAEVFSGCVMRLLSEKYFDGILAPKRPFSIFGYVNKGGEYYGCGHDGTHAQNICGFSEVALYNIYFSCARPYINKHFGCGHNISTDPWLMLTLRAIDGLDVGTLSEQETEHAARAVECGYLYRDGDMLYTKILVNAFSDSDRLFDITGGLRHGYFDAAAEAVAEKMAALIKASVPESLIGEWRFVNELAAMPLINSVVEHLVERGMLTLPENGIGAEGCWAEVER